VIALIVILGSTFSMEGSNLNGNAGVVPSEGEQHSKYPVCA
jgi:hypothetical protein